MNEIIIKTNNNNNSWAVCFIDAATTVSETRFYVEAFINKFACKKSRFELKRLFCN